VQKLLIIDGMNLLFRMFFGIPASLKNTRGEEIKGVIGFLGGIKKYCKIFSPDKLIAVFDSETGLTEKMAIDAEYKQNRIDYSDVPEELNPFSQLKYIYQVLDYLSIPYVEVKDYEADDYIASICEKYKVDLSCFIVSTDNDFMQLVDENVNLYNPTRDLLFTPELVYEKFNVFPHQMIDYKILAAVLGPIVLMPLILSLLSPTRIL
jgi:DNA polymerase-1